MLMLGQGTWLSPVFSVDASGRARIIVSVIRLVSGTDHELVSDLGFRVGVGDRYEAVVLERT